MAHEDQTDQKGFDYDRMREIMTGEVEAAIRGAREGGADEVVVCDGHDTGRNLLIEKMAVDCDVIQGSSYELGMMAGIGRDFGASLQVGYHSMKHTHAGTLGHTYTYSIAALKLNGVQVGESGLSAAIAGHFGVPLVFISGDLHAVMQTKKLVPGVIGVPTKEGVGIYAARSFAPRLVKDRIRKGAKEAVEKAGDIKPFALRKPINVEVRFERPLMAQYACQIPIVKRKDISTVSYKSRDMVEAFQMFDVLDKIASYAKSQGGI